MQRTSEYEFHPEVNSDSEEEWTTERFKDEFFLRLVRVKTNNTTSGKFVSDRKYYAQAKEKMYRIPVTKPSIPFVIYFCDLTPRLQSEFLEYCKYHCKREITIFLKEIAIRFFENIDLEYCHSSVMRSLRVRLER